MNTDDKTVFVENLLKGFREDIMRDLWRTPETWDGHELRYWIVERAKNLRWINYTRKEKRYIENDIIVNAL